MKEYTIVLSDEVASFYTLIAEEVNYSIEKVLADSLFRFAGEISINKLELSKNNFLYR